MKILALLLNLLFFSRNVSNAKKMRAKKIRAKKRKLFVFGLSLVGVVLASAAVSLDLLKKQKEKKTHLFYGSRF